jgi:predicted negative regulator of RcsB-dependent stress response
VALNAAEEENIEALKRWWEENRSMLFVIVLSAAVFGGGWTYWQNFSGSNANAASDTYEEIIGLVRVESGAEISSLNSARIVELAASLKSEHSNSVYARYAALFAAQQAVNSKDLESAERELQWIIDNSDGGLFRRGNEGLVLTAKLRLGRVILARGEAERALALVTGTDPQEFEAYFAELRGDIYLAMGQSGDARDSYLAAQQAGANSQFLRMKLDELADES